MRKYFDDILVTAGSLLIVYATYRISLTAALYVAGFLLILFGILIGISWKKVEK